MVYNLRGVARTLPGCLWIVAGVEIVVVMRVCGEGLDWEPGAVLYRIVDRDDQYVEGANLKGRVLRPITLNMV
jgi:hypothetical protein